MRKRANLVKGFITVEGGCDKFSADDARNFFLKVPTLSLWGDNSVGAKNTVNGDDRRNDCLAAVNAIKSAGGRASLLVLPDLGIKGNSHMMMMDKNNLQLADILLKWIDENAGK